MEHGHDVQAHRHLVTLPVHRRPRRRGSIGRGLQHVDPVAEVGHQGVAHLLVEGRGEELDHVGEADQEGRGQVAVVAQGHEEGAESRVDQLYVRLTVVSHELGKKRKY